jgi:hypothetical protein
VIRYGTAAAFKQAVETRLRSSSSSGIDFARRRQLLVFDRFLARIARELGDSAMLKAVSWSSFALSERAPPRISTSGSLGRQRNLSSVWGARAARSRRLHAGHRRAPCRAPADHERRNGLPRAALPRRLCGRGQAVR